MDKATTAVTRVWELFSGLVSKQLEAMRELGALIHRIENHSDNVKLGFVDDKGIALKGKALTDVRATFYFETCGITDTNFVSDARARGIAMASMKDVEVTLSREQFKALAPIFRDKNLGSFADRAKKAESILKVAQRAADKSDDGVLMGKHISAARKAKKRGARGVKVTPADALIEAGNDLSEAVKAVRAEDIARLSEGEMDTLQEQCDQFARILKNAATIAATDEAIKTA